MKLIKTLALGAAMLFGAQAMQAEFTYAPHSGIEPSLGAYLGVGGYGSTVEVGVAGQLRVADWVRIAPEVSLGIPESGYKNCFNVNLNVHSPWSLNAMAHFDNPRINVYPIGGLAIRHVGWETYGVGRGGTWTYSTSSTGYGINLGAGAEIYLTGNIKANLEFVDSWVSNNLTSFVTKAGIQFVF